jgi:hypothetical protein
MHVEPAPASGVAVAQNKIVSRVWRRLTMKQGTEFTPEERARIIAIGDLLIERYIEQREALEAGDRGHAIELQFEIKELMREKQKIKRWP